MSMRLRGPARQWAIYGLRLAFGIGILVACFTLLDVSALPEAFARLDAFWLAVAFVLVIVATILLPAMVTRRALETERIRLSLGELIELNFAIRFYALTLPRAVSYGIRWVRYRQAGTGSDAFALVVFEQLVQILAMTSVSVIVLAFEHPVLGKEGLALLMFLVATTLFVGFLLVPFFLPAATRWLAILTAFAARFAPDFIARRLQRLLDAVRAFHHLKARTVASIATLSLLCIVVMVLTWYIIALALNIEISLIAITWIRGVLFIMLLSPITVGGIGIREAGTVSLLHLYGVPAVDALALSLTLFAAQIAVGLIGAALELRRYFMRRHLASTGR